MRVLFVGEARPASGVFFYRADSGLYRALQQTFARAFPGAFAEDLFLESFRDAGCYLVDLCGTPVDHVGAKHRASLCQAGERRLSRTVARLEPRVVVVLLHRIIANVERAVAAAGWEGTLVTLPYPGRWKAHRDRFRRQLVPLLRRWAASGTVGLSLPRRL